MLKRHRKLIAREIARELLRLGVLFGDELEKYIIKGTEADITFKNEDDYFEFENYIIDYIEDYKSKFIEVTDTTKNKKTRFFSITEASKKLGIKENTLWNGIHNNSLIGNKYKASYCKLTITELQAGVS